MTTIPRLTACAVLSAAAACGPNGTTSDPAVRLHQARSLRCTFPAEVALLVVAPDRRTTPLSDGELFLTTITKAFQPDEMIVVRYDFNDRRIGHTIYEKGVPGRGAGDITGWWSNTDGWWFTETLPTRLTLGTTVFREQATIGTSIRPEYARGTSDFIAEVRTGIAGGFLNVMPPPPHASGTCKVVG